MLLDVTAIGPHDRSIVADMSRKKVYKLLVLNKIDLVEKQKLLGIIDDDFVASPFYKFNEPEREKIRQALAALPLVNGKINLVQPPTPLV